jgi:hypothetical protein
MATCCPFRLLMDRRLGILAWGGTHLSCMQCSMKKRKNIVVGKNINGEKKKKHSAGPTIHAYTYIDRSSSVCWNDHIVSRSVFPHGIIKRRKEQIKKRQIDREGHPTVPPAPLQLVPSLRWTPHGMHGKRKNTTAITKVPSRCFHKRRRAAGRPGRPAKDVGMAMYRVRVR